jgi:hypothetical protein
LGAAGRPLLLLHLWRRALGLLALWGRPLLLLHLGRRSLRLLALWGRALTHHHARRRPLHHGAGTSRRGPPASRPGPPQQVAPVGGRAAGDARGGAHQDEQRGGAARQWHDSCQTCQCGGVGARIGVRADACEQMPLAMMRCGGAAASCCAWRRTPNTGDWPHQYSICSCTTLTCCRGACGAGR